MIDTATKPALLRNLPVYNSGMPNFHRYYIPNRLVFITCVTHNRTPYLQAGNLNLFWQTMRDVQTLHAFHLMAYVMLPDHFHWLMKLSEDKPNFSPVIHSIKRNFTMRYKQVHHINKAFQLWQDRFWDHVIRDEADLARHIDYVHWNPVKHGHVQDPEAWEYSSFRHWLKQGYYGEGWGQAGEPISIIGLSSE